MEKIKCYELKQIKRQSDEWFINILNQFRIVTQLQSYVDTINNQCFCTLPNDKKIPWYSFYTNETKQKHNESAFLLSEGNVFKLWAQDRHHDTCSQSFQLQNDTNFTIWLHSKVQVKKNMLVKLCVRNYATHDGLVNGANGIFQGSTKVFNSQEVIWILFNNPKCGQFTRTKNAHLYEHEIHPTWTPVEPISKDIQIGSNSFHIITRTQFPIQLATTCIIHWTQGLTFDYLAFDPTNDYKHGLTSTPFFHVKKKENFHLLQPF